MKVTGTLLFLILLCNTSHAQTVFTTNGSALDWTNANNWTCGGCGFYPGQNASNDVVIINHPIRLQGSITLTIADVTINNATLEIRGGAGDPNLTTGPVTINSTGTGTAEFSVILGDPKLTIDGDLTINRNTEASGFSALTRFRLGGSSTNVTNATVTIFGNIEYNYLNASKSSAEGVTEISVGMSTSFNDKCTLTISRDVNLTYNYVNVFQQNALAFEVGNSSFVEMGNLNLSILEGGTESGADIRFAVLGNSGAKAIINGNATLLYNDPTPNPGSDNFLRAGRDNDPNSNVEIQIKGHLNMDSRYSSTSNNNQVRISGNSKIAVNRDMVLMASVNIGEHRENRIQIYNSGKLSLHGAITNTTQGVFELEAGGESDITTIEFNGMVPQNFPTQFGVNQNYKNIIINNSSGTPMVIPTTQLRVEGSLQMINGIIQSTASNIVVFEDGATSNGGTATSYVTGPVRKRGGTINNDILLPLGEGNRWAPFEIANLVGATSSTLFTVQYFNSPYNNRITDGTFSLVSKKEYWNVSVSGTVPTADITLHWKDACFSEINSVATPPSQDLYIGRFNSATSRWNLLPASTITPLSNACNSAPYTGSIKVTGLTSFNALTLVSPLGVALPIKLVDFWVEQTENHQAKIKWITEFEQATSHYLVQRLTHTTSSNFETIGHIVAAENSRELKHYEFIDTQIHEEKTYYRLVQVDADGTETIYPLISFMPNDLNTSIKLYPNPVSKQNYLDVYQPNSIGNTYSMYTHVGIEVTNAITIENLTNNIRRLHLDQLPNGIYLIKAFSKSGITTHRVYIDR
ncbi:MAG: T9SS type A sorting domain-containing protein [Chryseotalea sp.]